jgi:CRISPR/Cas system CMR-associated protein Cmr5 small subunit
MKERINQMIPTAMLAAENNLVKPKGSDKIPSVYKGYISAFGSGIVNSGLLTTVAMFYYSDSSEGDRKPLLKAIYETAFSETERNGQTELLKFLIARHTIDPHLSLEQTQIEDWLFVRSIWLNQKNN